MPLAGLEVSERTKAVDLQLKYKLVRIERLKAAGKPDRSQVAGEHEWDYSEDGGGSVYGMSKYDYTVLRTLRFIFIYSLS